MEYELKLKDLHLIWPQRLLEFPLPCSRVPLLMFSDRSSSPTSISAAVSQSLKRSVPVLDVCGKRCHSRKNRLVSRVLFRESPYAGNSRPRNRRSWIARRIWNLVPSSYSDCHGLEATDSCLFCSIMERKRLDRDLDSPSWFSSLMGSLRSAALTAAVHRPQYQCFS